MRLVFIDIKTTRVSDLATQAITTNEQATKYMGRKRLMPN